MITSEALPELLAEYAEIETTLSDPAVHADQARARQLGRRYAELGQVVETSRRLEQVRGDLAAARELSAEDASFAAEAETLAGEVADLEEKLVTLLLPSDPHDGKDVILEVKAGEGGEESALFAGDLLRMYLRYAERRGWRAEVLDATESDLGGFKDVAVAIKGRGAEGIWERLKYEGGVHRVQRVPVTESQGRIHTSAAGVLVLPEAEDVDVTIDPADLRIDVYRSSGPGGQSVNTTDSAVRITHVPTGIVVCPARTRSRSCRTVSRPCGFCAPGCWPRRRRKPTPPRTTPGAARSAPSTGASGSGRTTSRRTGSLTTASGTRPTTLTRCSTATSTR